MKLKHSLALLALPLVLTLTAFVHHPLTWVALGDSITYLNDHPNETGNRLTKGYMTQVTDKLSYVHYINQGHNGWTVVRIAENIDKLGLVPADVYTVFLGTNDWWHGNPLGTLDDYTNSTGTRTIYGAYRVIIDKLKQLNKDATIILITPMQRGDFVYINGAKNNAYGSYKPNKDSLTLEQVAAAVQNIGEHEHMKVIDLYHERHMTLPHMVKYKRLKDTATGQYRNYKWPDYTSIPFNPETDEYPYPADASNITYDGLHPSDKGDAIIAKKLVKAFKKL